MDGVREILAFALHGGIQVNKGQVLLLGNLLDEGYDAVKDDAVIYAPGMTVGGYWQAEPDPGFGGQGTE